MSTKAAKEAESCSIVVLSDRECTAPALQNWFNKNEHRCTVQVAHHLGAGSSHIQEHGPFAGIGFFQDWALAAMYARHGFVGSLDRLGLRSSSRLIHETMGKYS